MTGESSIHQVPRNRVGQIWLAWPEFACLILLSTLSLGLSGCGEPTPTIRDNDDPAMQTTAPETQEQSSDAADISGASTDNGSSDEIELASAVPHLDDNGERIFIPDLGWLPVAEFWELYENDPSALPSTLDYHAIHLLKEKRG